MSEPYEPNVGQEADEAAAAKKQAEKPHDPSSTSPQPRAAPSEAQEEKIMDEGETTDFETEINALNDKILRLAAELENTRRRAQREKTEAGKYAIANFARDLLPVADNFERALAAVDMDESQLSAEAISSLLTGVRLTEKELLKTLERHGVYRVEPTGNKFDPNLHQAVAQAPASGVPQGHVAQTAQTGFVLGDRILRAAMVIVSTGEPAGGSAEERNDGKGGNVDTEA